MSKDLVVLTPNGRRQKIHCTPDTSMLQVLEDVCKKQGFQPTDYDLKHHNHILDLTTTIRFSNIPNKATLEMVETDKRRTESNVTVGLLLEDGERRTADFPPHTSLYELAESLASKELNSLGNPMIMYMRQEVVGAAALKDKTLRQLGLLGGRAMLRLLNKAEESTQANVSAVYRIPIQQKQSLVGDNPTLNTEEKIVTPNDPYESPKPGPSSSAGIENHELDPVQMYKKEKYALQTANNNQQDTVTAAIQSTTQQALQEVMDTEDTQTDTSSMSLASKITWERRLNIEDEVVFIGTQKAIVFMQPDNVEDDLEDVPDDFYDLTIDEVKKLYHELKKNRLALEETPLLTTNKKEQLMKQSSEQRMKMYNNVVVRLQFPDQIILQGVFTPTSTIQNVIDFIKEHLNTPNEPFHIFTTPLKEMLDPKMTLLEARFVPCVHMHFKWLNEDMGPPYLREEIYSRQTSSDAASILASKYRAPNRRKIDNAFANQQKVPAGTSRTGKVPKWFKT